MKLNKRMVVMGLVVLALMILSMTLSMARSWGPNPIFIAPGLRENGAYTMMVPGTYGHLVPILPYPGPIEKNLIPTRTPGMEDGKSPMSAPGNNARGGSGSPTPAPKTGSGGMAVGGNPVGNFSSGGTVSSRVENLESDLRAAIRKLNS